MGIPAGALFNIKATGTGVSDNNGGFWVPGSSGTDYSQQNAPQYALTGLASSGSGNTVLSAAASADMVGNGANAVSGTNVNTGIFHVLSVVVGVSITFSTNAAGQSICSGVAASLVLNIGGRLLTIAKAQGACSIGDTFYLNGSFTVTAEIAIATANTAGAAFYIGYTTTLTDGGQATITTSTNSVDVFNTSSCNNIVFKNLSISVTAGTPGSCINARTADCNRVRLVNCILSGGDRCIRGNRSGADFGIDGLSIEFCEIKSATNHGVNNTNVTFISHSFIHDCGGSGFLADTNHVSTMMAFHTVFYKNGVSGVSCSDGNTSPLTQNYAFWNCVFSTNTGAGVLSTNGAPYIQIQNCIFDRNTTYGVDLGTAAGASHVVQYNNAFYNTGGQVARRGNADVLPVSGDVTLSADPYTSVGTNFALNSTTGGGAACKAAGIPGVLAWGTGYANIGAFDPAGGTAGMFFNPGMAGGFE